MKQVNMKCIRCDKTIKRDKKTGVLIGGLELVAYAHHKSEHDMGTVNPDSKTALLCICDKCFKSEISNIYKFSNVRNSQYVQYEVE